MPSCSSPVSDMSHSDYGTLSVSSDDDGICSRAYFAPGICPHCKEIFQEPMSLPCGHSLCLRCIDYLLMNQAPVNYRRNRIRMGINSCHLSFPGSTRRSDDKIQYRSPSCPVCHAKAKTTAPIPNVELKYFIDSINVCDYMNPCYRKHVQTSPKIEFDTDEEITCCIKDCRITLLGAAGVGKTSIRIAQYCNDLLFTNVLDRRGVDDSANSYMLDIIDGNHQEKNLKETQGFVVVYSITDRESFYAAKNICSEIVALKGIKVPIVLVGSKADNNKNRRVTSFEGQQLARHVSCPFLEVSAKKNENVHQAFVELVRMVALLSEH